MPTPSPAGRFRFGPYELDVSSSELSKNRRRIRIQRQPLKILALLLERPGQMVTREELRMLLWPDGLYVDFEHGLNRSVNKLRRALLDSANSPRYIETLHSLGYRFIAPVEALKNGHGDPGRSVVGTAGSKPLAETIKDRVPVAAGIPSTVNLEVLSKAGQRSRTVFLSIAAIVLLVATGAVVRQRLYLRPVAESSRTLLVILPFENLTGDANQDYICEGMTEELIARLGNADPDHLGVIARTTAMHYKGTSKTVKEIADELGVSYVLESSIRRVDNRVRVTTQLIKSQEQHHLWARSFDRDASDILGLQHDLSLMIAEEIPRYLGTSKQARAEPSSPVNSQAYLDYLKGRFFWNERSADALHRSVSYFQKAIEEDPRYARAYAGLADSYLVLGGGYLPPHQTYQKGATAAMDALALDGELADAHTSLAYFKFIDEWDWAGADREFREAIRRDPGYATAHHWYALYLSAMNRMPEAINEINKALDIDPLSIVINSNAGAIYYQAGDAERARRQLLKTLELDPNFIPAFGYLGYIYQTTGRYEDALAEYRKAQKHSGDSLSYAGDVGRIYALTGRKPEAIALIQRLQSASKPQVGLSGFTLCLIYASLGNSDAALKWLAKSIDDREFTATELSHDLRIGALRTDPRFAQIQHEFNIPKSAFALRQRLGTFSEPQRVRLNKSE